MRRARLWSLLLLVVAQPSSATTIDLSPRPAFLLRSGAFVAQDGPTSVTLYDATGKPLHRFVTCGIAAIDVSSDERHLIVGCGDGGLLLGDLKDGTITWTKKAAETGLRFVYDVSFSGDAKSLVAADDQGRVHVFETSTGKRIASVGFGPMESRVMSAALSPDGSNGAFVELSGRVFTFDVASGSMRDTGLTGAWPVRFTADGRYFALRSANSGLTEQLRVVDATDTTLTKDLGQFMLIGRIRPSADGTLSLTGVVKNGNATGQKSVGLTCDPRTGEMRTVWESGAGWIDRGRTDFDAQAVRGVSTDYRLVTSVVDLKTDTAVLTVDNSANFRPTVASWTLVLQIWPLLTAGACVVVAVVVLVRHRRHASVPARAAA